MSAEEANADGLATLESKASPAAAPVPFGVRTEQQLKALYKLAGKYNGDMKQKQTKMQNQIGKIVAAADEYLANPSSTFSAESQEDKSAPPSRAQCYFWKGRALDADGKYSPEVRWQSPVQA